MVFIAWIGVDSIRADQSTRWPETDSEVVQSRVVAGQGKSAGRFFADVQYRYMVAGELYYSSRIMFGDQPYFQSPAEAAAFIGAFPQFGKVSVRYSESSPEVSVLLPGRLPPHFQSRLLPFSAGFFVFLVLGVSLLRARSNRVAGGI